MHKKTIVVGLAGNPNSGKTTIFNALTGSRQKVANWSGVTVEKREGRLSYKGYNIIIVDLPGTYSLSSFSIEEIVARDFIIGSHFRRSQHGEGRKSRFSGRRRHHNHSHHAQFFEEYTHQPADHPDVIINVVDAGNLERNLYLTTQLIEMNARIVMALNMYDEAETKGFNINTDTLSTLLGMDIVKTIATKSIGIDKLLDAVINVCLKKSPKTRHLHINYGADLEKEIKNIQETIWSDEEIGQKYSTRWLAMRLIEGDPDAEKKLKSFTNYNNIKKQVQESKTEIEKKFHDSIDTVLTDMRYGFITGAIRESVTRTKAKRKDLSEKIDKFVTNRYLAFPILIVFLWLLFQLTFSLGKYPMDWIEKGVSLISALFEKQIPEGPLKDLLIDGIIGGVGGVIVFLPNILILFMGISFMEDTGYMARAAFKMDKIMHTMGLHGKSFISLVMGFGCNVPAIMATRSLESTRDRILTILINPFMSCSARLPVYVLFAGTFFHKYAGAVIASLYFIGVIFAFISAKLFRAVFFKGESTPFVMELPPYRMPTLKTTLLHMWDRGSVYLKKVGGIILVFSIIIWVLSAYPKTDNNEEYNLKIEKITADYKANRNILISRHGEVPEELNMLKDEYLSKKEQLQLEMKSEQMKNTFIGKFGKIILPVIKPLGFNWQMGISLTTGFIAKEIVVSTMGVLYHASESEEEGALIKPLNQVLKKKEFGITPLIAYTFLLFVLLYVPCLGTVVVMGREAGWSWALFSIVYQIILAWIVCFLFYNAGLLLGFR
ncbi:MAG: ferrous iron transport protein B [Spirochaetes bacterium]|nr:ferrous iron transport protein B [Spirochaetota bacterium]